MSKSLAASIQATLRHSLRAQRYTEAQSLERLATVLETAADDLTRKIATVPRGTVGERYQRALLGHVSAAATRIQAEATDIVDSGILTAAGNAATQAESTLEMLYEARHALAPDQRLIISHEYGQLRAGVSFGHVPVTVLKRLAARVYPDGLRLSQRLYNLGRDARLLLADAVVKGIATGQSAKELAKAITPILTETGVDNVRYKAMRIARTEINVAYREGHVASATDAAGKLKPYILAIGFRLSPSHPRICICDLYAGQDIDGLGAGNYLPENVPTAPHPHCLCYLVSILAALPDQQFIALAPHPDDVPPGQLRYYHADAAP